MPLLTKRQFRCPDCGRKHGEEISVLKKRTEKRCTYCREPRSPESVTRLR